MRGAILKILAGTALAVAAAQPAFAAVTIATGSQMSIGGNAQLIGGVTASQATSIDFLAMPGSVPGATPGTVTNYLGTGTFLGQSCSGTCGTINDITSLVVGGSVVPLFSLTDGVTFSLTNITSIDRSVSNVLAFQGTGTFGGTLGGEAINPQLGSFVFTTQGGSLTTFSATALASAVPEPAAWGLMIFGFAGIGVLLRRRRRPALAQVA